MPKPDLPLYREEALRHQSQGAIEGDVLRLSPKWTRPAYWVLVAFFLLGLVYCIVGTLHEYAEGPAVVWVSGRMHITTTVSGTVSSIEVKPGQKVVSGQVLVRFSSAVESAEVGRLDREFEQKLAKSLADPGDLDAKAALTALRTQREVAMARLEQLTIRAPREGFISDVRIRSGQLLTAGDVVLTLLETEKQCSVVAMLPAQYKPQLRPGLSMRFEMKGYRYAYQEMTIDSVGEQIIGPNEVKRYLGQEIQDTVPVEGPVVLVEAKPKTTTFEVDGEPFDFYHGMNGTAEVRVRTESILFSMLPSLRTILARPRE